jgi:uncharacterized protein (DUF1499 family)
MYAAWLLLLPTALLIGCQGTRPANLGMKDGILAPCPSTPNCVSSQATDPRHRIEPLPYTGSPAEALARLAGIVGLLPRATVIARSDGYLHADFTSLLFRFVDDVEFLVDDRAKVIHVRSASQMGYSDLGVNRTRIEEIRRLWKAPPPPS